MSIRIGLNFGPNSDTPPEGVAADYTALMERLGPLAVVRAEVRRDLARLVEVAALDQKLKSMGQNSAVEFNQRLLNIMQKKKEA